MPIRVECDQCFKAYNVPEERRGKQFKCRECGNRLTAGGAEQDPYGSSYESALPPRRSSNRNHSQAAKKSAGGSSALVPILIGVIAFAVVGTGAYFAVTTLMGKGNADAANLNAANGAPVANAPPVANSDPAIAGVPAMGTPAAGPGIVVPPAAVGIPPVTSLPAKEAPVTWSASIDPPKNVITWPQELKLGIPCEGDFDGQLYPATPSSFMVAGIYLGKFEKAMVIDLATGKETGRFPGKFEHHLERALSPDGRCVAIGRGNPRGVIDIWTPDAVQPSNTLQVTSQPSDQLNYLAFRSPTEIVMAGFTTTNGQIAAQIKVFNVETGAVVSQQSTTKPVHFETLTLSPGGRFLYSGDTSNDLTVFDLDAGTCVGELSLSSTSDAGNSLNTESVGTTNDGSLIYVMQSGPWETRVLFLDAASGRETERLNLPGDVHSLADNSMLYKGRQIQFMRDDAYLLLAGQLLVHRKSKRIVWSLSVKPSEDQYRLTNNAERRVAGDHLVFVDGPHNMPELDTMAIPFDKIEAGLAAVESSSPASLSPANGEVTLNIDVAAVRFGDVSKTQTELASTLTDRLTIEGLKVVDGSKAVLTLKYAEGTGATLSQGNAPFGAPTAPAASGVTLESTKATIELSLAVEKKEVWSKSIVLDPSVLFVQGDATAQSARDKVFEQVQKALYGIPVVWYVSESMPYVTLPILESLETQSISIGGQRPKRRKR